MALFGPDDALRTVTTGNAVKKYKNMTVWPHLIWTALIAAAYFGAGVLGLLLAVPPSNAGAVWPPAGIALSAVLLLGPRIWPGVFLGNFAVSAYAFGFEQGDWLIYAATGAGATLNALVGAALVRRFVGFPNRLIEDGPILKFFLLGGVVSCLIPATVGLAVMSSAGIVSREDLLFNWLSWWSGDTIGVFLFAPLTLIFFGPKVPEWRQRRLSVGVPLVVTFLLVVVFFLYANRLERDRQSREFEQLTSSIVRSFESRLEADVQALMALKSFFLGSKSVNPAEFSLFARQLLVRRPEMEALHWLEDRAQGASEPSFRSVMVEAAKKVRQGAPIVPPEVLAALRKERTSRGAIWVDYRDNVINFFVPVQWEKAGGGERPRGFLLARLSTSDLVAEACAGFENEFAQLSIVVDSSSEEQRTIFSTGASQVVSALAQKLQVDKWLSVGSDRWRIRFYPSAAFLSVYQSWALWWVLVLGLLFASLLGMGLLMLTGRFFRTEEIVRARTAELMQEISRHELTETALQHAKERAEAASLAKSQFLANVSHELRTPLNGILGFSQLLLKQTSVPSGDRSHLEVIRHSGEYLLTLINDILDLSKIESDKLEIRCSPFALKPFLEELVKMFRLRAREKGLEFNVQTEGLPTGCVDGDEKRLRQIFVNLLGNAVKFTETGSIEMRVAYRNDMLEFSVQDTGPGMTGEESGRIFQPFVQLISGGDGESGTGLGLAICKKLVQLMQGAIDVESAAGKGATFSVSIPLPEVSSMRHVSADAVLAKSEVMGYRGPRRAVMIVDDNRNNLELLASALRSVGFDVVVAGSGEECLKSYGDFAVDLVLMDMIMPKLDGIETTLRLREMYTDRAPLVIGISASAFRQERQRFLDAGCVSFVSKPILFDELFTAIGEALDLKWIYRDTEVAGSVTARVLVADDNKINRLLLSHLLEGMGCSVVEVEDGTEALKQLRENRFDCALLDLKMPGMGGMEVIRELRVEAGTATSSECRMFAISAFADREMVEEALAAGFEDYLTKPVDATKLQRMLRRCKQTNID